MIPRDAAGIEARLRAVPLVCRCTFRLTPHAECPHPEPDYTALAALVVGWQVGEWICERERMIHPPQRNGIFQPCPQCGEAMIPTSPERREIAQLRAQLDAREREIARLRGALNEAFILARNMRAGAISQLKFEQERDRIAALASAGSTPK